MKFTVSFIYVRVKWYMKNKEAFFNTSNAEKWPVAPVKAVGSEGVQYEFSNVYLQSLRI